MLLNNISNIFLCALLCAALLFVFALPPKMNSEHQCECQIIVPQDCQIRRIVGSDEKTITVTCTHDQFVKILDEE